METEYWYRYEEQQYAAPLDEFEEPQGSGELVLHLRKLKVLRRTPMGVQLIGLGHGSSNPRLVLHSSRKKFACPTVEEARLSFRKRKERQEGIHLARARTARAAIELMDMGREREGIDW